MEIYELRYFRAVASFESIHKASVEMNVSTGSLSKAVRRLEEEFETQFFERIGRGIRITEQGRYFSDQAQIILNMTEDLQLALKGHSASIKADIAGPEFLLSYFSEVVTKKILASFPSARFSLHVLDEDQSLRMLKERKCHLAFSSGNTKASKSLKIGTTQFQTLISKKHPKYRKWNNSPVTVQEVLKHPFTSSATGLLGKMNKGQSSDGWRDDKFPRDIRYVCSSLSAMIRLVQNGQAIAYLPDYIAKDHGFTALNVTGCPYSCSQNVFLHMNPEIQYGWLNQVYG